MFARIFGGMNRPDVQDVSVTRVIDSLIRQHERTQNDEQDSGNGGCFHGVRPASSMRDFGPG